MKDTTPLAASTRVGPEQRMDLGSKDYYQATRDALADPSTSYVLRKRIAEDDQRDPRESLTDARLLLALQEQRFSEQVGSIESITVDTLD